jgi:hypothetical protein
MTDELRLEKEYYFECIHWSIKLCIFQIRKNNYPLDWWHENLKNTLKQRNIYAIKIKNYKPKQLTLF